MTSSTTHLVLLPSYNTGPRLHKVVTDVLRRWQPVLLVIDGSTDSSELLLLEHAKMDPALIVLVLPRNSGKGAAVLAGARAAQERGFTHALVMDADGQHPDDSIEEFMTASQCHSRALILGRPIFPSNIPVARLYGRQLSIGLVHCELLGPAIADPLFGFRVYPIAPLIAALGKRRGGRRYDFDTEAAVRLGWAGVALHNISAPVRYFSRAEGGVSHFHYLRDNATLAWMHLRLIVELLLWRWPMVLQIRRHRLVAFGVLVLLIACNLAGRTAESDPLVNPEHRIEAVTPLWSDLVDAFSHSPDIIATFTERRRFPFRKEPVELKGEVRMSVTRGLSLHYIEPEESVIVLDANGVLIRASSEQNTSFADPRAAAANEALLHILRFDLTALEKDFDLYGQRKATTWTLVFVPRKETMRRSVGRITVSGKAATISLIEIRRSAKQAIEIAIEPPRPVKEFTAQELKLFFR